jgi:hypothetical protein
MGTCEIDAGNDSSAAEAVGSLGLLASQPTGRNELDPQTRAIEPNREGPTQGRTHNRQNIRHRSHQLPEPTQHPYRTFLCAVGAQQRIGSSTCHPILVAGISTSLPWAEYWPLRKSAWASIASFLLSTGIGPGRSTFSLPMDRRLGIAWFRPLLITMRRAGHIHC